MVGKVVYVMVVGCCFVVGFLSYVVNVVVIGKYE